MAEVIGLLLTYVLFSVVVVISARLLKVSVRAFFGLWTVIYWMTGSIYLVVTKLL